MPYLAIWAMIYLYFKYMKILNSTPCLCLAMDIFVFNAFQITPSLTSILQFGHSGHKTSFTALFSPKIHHIFIHVWAFMCDLQAQYSGKNIFEIFTLCISNCFVKVQVVSEIQQFFENIFLRNYPDMPQNNQKRSQISYFSKRNIFEKSLYL